MVIQQDISLFEQMQQALRRLLPVSTVPFQSPAAQTFGQVRPDALRLLYDDVVRLHPEAGRHYWNAHTWRTSMWVPVYCTILAFEHFHCMVDARRMQVLYAEGLAKEIFVPAEAISQGISDEKVPARALSEALDNIRAALSCITPVPPKLAGRHTADSILAALLLYYHDLPEYDNQHIRQRGECWLSAMGLSAESGYLDIDMSSYGLPDRIALNRRVCCQYFRCANAVLCSNCPKIPMEQRLPLLAQGWAEHDKAHADADADAQAQAQARTHDKTNTDADAHAEEKA